MVIVDGEPERSTASSVTSVFALAGLVGFVVALLPYRVGSAAPVPSAIAHYAEGRVQTFSAELEAGATGVVLLGDSRLLYGTASDYTMQQRLGSALGADVAVMRLAGPGATYQNYASVADAIVDAQPRLVVLQEDLLDRRDTSAPVVSARNTILWNAAGGELWNPTGNLLPLDQDWDVCPDGALTGLAPSDAVEAILASQEASGLEYRSHGTHVEAVEDFVARLLGAGVDVVTLAIPQTALADEAIPRSATARSTSVEQLVVDVTIDDNDYCDPAHLSPHGRDRFVDALVPAIAYRMGRA